MDSFLREHSSQSLLEVEAMMNNELRIQPKDFKGPMIFPSFYNDNDGTQIGN